MDKEPEQLEFWPLHFISLKAVSIGVKLPVGSVIEKHDACFLYYRIIM